ncbi:MAG: vanadium-dependent haloperoxidase [Verrucomicrobiota bacterium JB023]|nr:vanadium-dependent haloperoxidase [Verrucomicrobiota bacterium JB023]
MKLKLAPLPLLALAVAEPTWAQRPESPRDYVGPNVRPNPRAPRLDEDRNRQERDRPDGTEESDFGSSPSIREWNTIAVDASGLDHTPVNDGEDRVYGEQLGPCRASRAMAIVHIAMFEAHNSAVGQPYLSYLQLAPAEGEVSADAAIAQAAHDTLASLFPSQASAFGESLTATLDGIPDGLAEDNGIALGRAAAQAVLTVRADDHSDHEEPIIGIDYFTSNEPGRWRQAPISEGPIALGALWSTVTPFTLKSAEQFRSPAPPELDSLSHTLAYVEAKRLGGDGVVTPTERTEEEEFIGVYWAYDGTPSLCAPPRLYNQLILTVAEEMGTEGLALSRLLALANVAMADTAIATWDSKYYHDRGRPITLIREAGTGIYDDGNPDTVQDVSWTPLGAPASNLLGPNFTPPFPSYPSGHAAFGGAVFETLRNYYGRDDIAFTFVSDEYNGVTLDNTGEVRELKPRSFDSLSQAEIENGDSRIYLGIHWSYDSYEGIELGRNVANHVFTTAYQPASDEEGDENIDGDRRRR